MKKVNKNLNANVNKTQEKLIDVDVAINSIISFLQHLEMKINSLDMQMDMVAILSNALSELLLDKGIIDESELKEILTLYKLKLDEEQNKKKKRDEKINEIKHFSSILKFGNHGNA